MANIRTAMNRGAFDFLTKPIDFADFETTIAQDASPMSARLREAQRAPGDRPSARMRRWRAISRPIWRESLAGDANALAPGGDGARSRPYSPTSPASPRWSRPWTRRSCPTLLGDYLDRHDGDRLRARGNGRQDHRRRHPCPVRRAGRSARRRARARSICALALDAWAEAFRARWRDARRAARRDAHRRSRRAGDRRQFRRRAAVRLHSLWRHHQRRRAAGGG